MYAVGVSDHIMIAHSLRGAVFGPAQRLHGATYEVRVEVLAPALDADGIVVDIGRLRDALAQALAPLAYRNLDELAEFAGRNSTTEVLCEYVHRRLCGLLGARPGAELAVTLVESPNAWARYQAALA
ncbi:MAG TPA: 6-carboxytetrahydropterin synthase [Chloroflexota bacterium]|nr:6-carboxytetrahydropterin synthase [Chloroflexota bacterium]